MDGEADDVARVGLVHRLTALRHKGHHRGRAQFFAGALHLHLHARGVLAAGHAHKSDAVAVVLVHIGLHLEHHARETFVFRVDGALFALAVHLGEGDARAGWRRHIDHRVQHFHHTKVVHTGAEEHGRELASQEVRVVPFGGSALGQLHAVDGVVIGLAKTGAQLVHFGQRNDFKVFGALFAARGKHGHALRLQIDDAAEALALAHRPGDGATRHAQLSLDLVHDVQRVAHFTVELIDERDDGRVALAANFDQAAGLRFHTICCIDHHQGRVHGRQHAVGVFREVLVAGCVQQVDHVVSVAHLHHRRCHRNTTLLFNLHPVRRSVARSLAALDGTGNLDRTREQQQLFGQRGLTRVRVGDDGKGAATPCFWCV